MNQLINFVVVKITGSYNRIVHRASLLLLLFHYIRPSMTRRSKCMIYVCQEVGLLNINTRDKK